MKPILEPDQTLLAYNQGLISKKSVEMVQKGMRALLAPYRGHLRVEVLIKSNPVRQRGRQAVAFGSRLFIRQGQPCPADPHDKPGPGFFQFSRPLRVAGIFYLAAPVGAGRIQISASQFSGRLKITHFRNGLDGIKNSYLPGNPAEEDLFEEESMGKYDQVKGSLSEVLDALEADHDYLLEGGVFTPDLIEAYVAYKRQEEVDAVRLRPHPQEFVMYYGI